MTTKFQQRHYEAIAEVIKRSEYMGESKEGLVNRLIEMFANDNPNFKESRFREAMKYTENETN